MATAEHLDSSGIDLEPEDLLPEPAHRDPPVDLDGLRKALTEDLGIAVDEPGRPAAFDPSRVSHDEQRWCSLATYGHPRIEEALAGPAGDAPNPGLIEAVAFASEDGVWAAWRADRNPPVPVKTIGDLADMGEAAASGAAAERALDACRRVASGRARHLAERAGQTHEQWLANIRSRFTQLAREVVDAESALHARTGNGMIEPRMVWLDLTGDKSTAWRIARSFAQHLDMEEASLLPAHPAGTDARSNAELSAVRKEVARQLNNLEKEWKAGAAGSPTQ